MRELTPLCELAKKYGTDKGGRHLIAGDTCHEYTPVYWDLFGDRREEVRAVLEVGINYGCSLRMWEEFFPNAVIIGLDCEPRTLINEGRIQSYLAHQSSSEQLLYAMQQIATKNPELPQFDLIVDDGSHKMDDQVLTMRALLPFLHPEGCYVIEDMNVHHAPQLTGAHVPPEILGRPYRWDAILCDPGIGKAMCGCGCGQPENLFVVRVAHD